MATSSIASLVVSLEANIAKFSTDMKRASDDVAKTMGTIQKGAQAAKTALGLLGVGLSVGAITAWSSGVIQAAEALNDLSKATGSSVEDLSKLRNQAKVAGGDFDAFENVLLKLSTKLGATEDDTSAFGIALKNLGVTSQDPAKALQEVIAGFDKFADSATKAAYAKEIFGKGGAKFLGTLADMAHMQDVAATMTAKQVEEAEKLAQSLRQLQVESTRFQDILLSLVVPSLNTFMSSMVDANRIAGNLADGIRVFAQLNPFGAAADDLTYLRKELDKVNAGIAGSSSPQPVLESEKATLQKAIEVAKLKQIRELGRLDDPANYDRLDRLRGAGKPSLPKLPGTGGTAGAKQAVTDYAEEIDKLNHAMERLASGQGGAEHYDAALEKVGHDLRNNVSITNASIDSYLAAAKALDTLTQEHKDWDEAMKAAEIRAEKEQQQLKAFEEAQKKTTEGINEYIAALNIQTQTMFMSNQEAERYIELAKLQAYYEKGLIASENDLNAAKAAVNSALNLRNAAADTKAMLDEQKRYAEEINAIFTDAIGNNITDAVMGTKSLSAAFRDMERQIVGSLSRIASQNIAKAIFGDTGSGGGIGGVLGGFLGGGAKGGNSFNTMGMSAGLDSFLFSIFGGAASGGGIPANRPIFVGEKGPELFVPQSAGNVIPNDVLSARRAHQQSIVNISVNVDGATTRATADQVALRTGVAVRRALARNS